LATRYKISPRLNLRGSISTGFRAPSLQQINFSSTFTTVQAGNIAEVKIAPNYSPITKSAGIEALKQEKSTNASLGFSWNASKSLQITFDAYQVNIKDRIVLSGQFDGEDPNLDATLRAQMALLKVSYAQFFANAVNTTNRGVDLVVDYSKKWGKRNLKGLIAGNLQKMSVDKINVPVKLAASTFLQQTFLSDREQNFILASAPNTKISSLVEYGIDRYSVGARFTYFGKVSLLGFGEDGLGINPTVPLDNGSGNVPDQYDYRGKGTVDLYGSYRFNSHLTLFTGVDNLFNVHPDLGVAKGAKDWAYNNETGGPWDAVQMGGNGRRFFLKLAFSLN
jgi:iron complex outermembrane receptor protein